jgi:hypothetical protein
MKKISIALMLVLLVAAGCSSSNNNKELEGYVTDNPEGLEISVIEKGFYSNYTEKKNLLINNQKDFDEVWNKAHALVNPIPAVPVVNFSEHSVIAVFMGQKSSGGYAVTIEKVVAKVKASSPPSAPVLEVYVKETVPSEDSVGTQALTQPFHIVKVGGNYSHANFVFTK